LENGFKIYIFFVNFGNFPLSGKWVFLLEEPTFIV